MRRVDEATRMESVKAELGLVGKGAFVVLGVVLAVSILRVADDPFRVNEGSYSHDGVNGVAWTTGSAALRHDPIGSRLGAVREDGSVYTNHPPLILVETAASEVVFGERKWAQRLPAWSGTLAAVVLLERVLRRERVRPDARAVGLLVGFASPMVLTYGTMLDTPMTSLPFAVWCLLAWQRQRDGDAHRWERPVTCALAVLAGWQAALLAGVTLLPRRGRSLGAVAGFVIGVTLIAGWQAWVHGGLGDIMETFGERSGTADWGHPMSPWDAVENQVGWLLRLFTPVPLIVGAVGIVVAVRRRQQLAVLIAAVAVLYPAATSNALGWHEYWLYWLALPITVGAAVLVDCVKRPDSETDQRLVLSGERLHLGGDLSVRR